MSGPAISSWEATSAGVRIADSVKIAMMAYRHEPTRRCGVSNPMRVKKNVKTGNSKVMPKASSSRAENERYSLIRSVGVTPRCSYSFRKNP
jgi:hypothetical protein